MINVIIYMKSFDFWKSFLIFEATQRLSTPLQNFIVIRSLTTKIHREGGIRFRPNLHMQKKPSPIRVYSILISL